MRSPLCRAALEWELPEWVLSDFHASTLARLSLWYRVRLYRYRNDVRRSRAVLEEAERHFRDPDKRYYNFTW